VRDEVRRQIMSRLISGDADVSFQTDFLDNYLADDTSTIDRVSNVHDWKPALPVRMYHGRNDLTVTYKASTRTLQTMQANGSTMASLTDCPATPAGHLECVPPYFSFMLAQLAPVVKDL
jgi:carboxypeptidase C (cathepsin A)